MRQYSQHAEPISEIRRHARVRRVIFRIMRKRSIRQAAIANFPSTLVDGVYKTNTKIRPRLPRATEAKWIRLAQLAAVIGGGGVVNLVVGRGGLAVCVDGLAGGDFGRDCSADVRGSRDLDANGNQVDRKRELQQMTYCCSVCRPRKRCTSQALW